MDVFTRVVKINKRDGFVLGLDLRMAVIEVDVMGGILLCILKKTKDLAY